MVIFEAMLVFLLPVELFGRRDADFVVYFDQQTQDCACVGMVENNSKHSKIMKQVPIYLCAQEAHVRLM